MTLTTGVEMTQDVALLMRQAGEHVLACVALSRAEGTEAALTLTDSEAETLALWLDEEGVRGASASAVEFARVIVAKTDYDE